MREGWVLAIMRKNDTHVLIHYDYEPLTIKCIKETEHVLEYFSRPENINRDMRLVAYEYIKENSGVWGSEEERKALAKDYSVDALKYGYASNGALYVIPENVGKIFCDKGYNAYIDFDNDEICVNTLNIAYKYADILKMSGLEDSHIKPYRVDENYMNFPFWHSDDMLSLYQKWTILYNGMFFYSLKT